MSNFWNSLKALTLVNQNLAKVNSHVGHFKKICREPGQNCPKQRPKLTNHADIVLWLGLKKPKTY